MMFYEKLNLYLDKDEFLPANQAKKLTVLAITDRERKIKEGFNLWLEENKKNIRNKIIEACGQGKDSITYQHVPEDYCDLFISYLFSLGYVTKKQSTYINGENTNYSVYVSWRY